jgi:hypothetical protein
LGIIYDQITKKSNKIRIRGPSMNKNIIVLMVALVLVLSAGMAINSFAGTRSTLSKGSEKWALLPFITIPGASIVNVSGWESVSVSMYCPDNCNGAYLAWGDNTSGPFSPAAGCLGAGNAGSNPFYQYDECAPPDTGLGSAVLTSIVQGEILACINCPSTSDLSVYVSMTPVNGG